MNSIIVLLISFFPFFSNSASLADVRKKYSALRLVPNTKQPTPVKAKVQTNLGGELLVKKTVSTAKKPLSAPTSYAKVRPKVQSHQEVEKLKKST